MHLWFVACETRHRRAGPVYRGSVAVCREFIWLKIVKRATGHIYTIDTMYKILITDDILPVQGTYSVHYGDLNGEENFFKRVGYICVADSFYCTVKKPAQHYKIN